MARSRQLLWFFIITFAGSWSVVALPAFAPELTRRVFGEFTLDNPAVILAVYMPSLTGIGLTALWEGRPGLARLVRRLNPAGFRPLWYLVVLLGIPTVTAAVLLAQGERPTLAGPGAAATVLATSLLFDPGPIGEETGWRGYALPRLLERWSPLTASLILGVIWAIWHLPAFFLPGMPQSQLNLGVFFAGAVAVSVVMTWTQLGTGASILIAILVHLSANHANDLVGGDFNDMTIAFLVAAVVIVVLHRGRFLARPARSDGGTAG